MNKQPTSEVQSPCVSNCCLDDDDVCLGCFRTLDDILRWSKTNDSQKTEIIKSAKRRSLQHSNKYKKLVQ